MFVVIFILGIAPALCQLQATNSIKPTLDVQPVLPEDNSNDQLRLFSPIDVNPDEFQNRGKLYKPICAAMEVETSSVRNGKSGSLQADYFTAFRSCMKDGLQLVRDTSPEDSKQLREIVKSMGDGQQVWFSGTDLGKPDSWIWLSTLRPVGEINDYLNWKDGEPSMNGHCMAAEIIATGEMKWSAVDCDTALCYVCEKNLT